MSKLTIKGIVKYQELGTGFWGIIGEDGTKWKPTEMPKALQKENLGVEITAKKIGGAVSVFMWGETIEILDFNSKE